MLIYLIIAAELAILYTVFWYVYIRDPKPYKIVGNPWGKYGESGFTAGGADPTLPFVINRDEELRLWWRLQEAAADYPDDVLYEGPARARKQRSQPNRRLTPQRLCRRRRPPEPRQTAEAAADQRHFISRVVAMFTRTLDTLNVKTP